MAEQCFLSDRPSQSSEQHPSFLFDSKGEVCREREKVAGREEFKDTSISALCPVHSVSLQWSVSEVSRAT